MNDDLTLRITGLLPAGDAHVRQVLFDEIERRLPRDAEARVNIQLSELAPRGTAPWHIHNGIVYFVVVRGLVTLQYDGESQHYQAGDVYTEPIGVIHRAVNPHTDLTAAFVGFWVTASDRPHVTNVAAPEWNPVEDAHPLS